jgi:hypothetical protein
MANRCVTANADIAGVGVRLSIYIQALLNLVSIAIFSEDGEISENEYRILAGTSHNLFITGCAILVASLIQGTTYGLSVYHVLIVLNLGWINSFSAVTGIMMGILDSAPGSKAIVRKASTGQEGGNHGDNQEREHPFRRWLKHSDVLKSAIKLGIIHLSLLGAVGIWVWSRIDIFGHEPGCTPRTFLTVFGHDVAATNRSLRAASLFFYSIIAIPVLNVLFLPLLCLALIFLPAIIFLPSYVFNCIKSP